MITISNEYLTVKIKEFGAEITSVVDNRSGYEFMWQGDPDYWGRQAPVLFPIVGRLKNNQYEYKGKTYEMTQHGFARDSVFEVVDAKENFAAFSLRYNEDTLKKYPFEFELEIRYTLKDRLVEVEYVVKNVSNDEVMYYGVGGHPAFNVSQKVDENGEPEFDEISVRLESNEEVVSLPLSANAYLDLENATSQDPTSKELTHESFKEDANIYMVKSGTKTILTDRTENVEVHLDNREMEYVGIWSPYPARGGFVCLEPWAGITDTENATGLFEEKYAMNVLSEEEQRVHSYTLEFKKD